MIPSEELREKYARGKITHNILSFLLFLTDSYNRKFRCEFKDDKYNGKGRILGNMLFSPSEDLGDGLSAGTGEAFFVDGHIKR